MSQTYIITAERQQSSWGMAAVQDVVRSTSQKAAEWYAKALWPPREGWVNHIARPA